MTRWHHLAWLSGAEAKQAARSEAWLAAKMVERLGRRAAAWSRLPLIVRVRVQGENAPRRRHFPNRVLDLAPPRPDPEQLGRHGSFLLLDTDQRRLVVVLHDWDALRLDRLSLGEVGIDVDQLAAALEVTGARGVHRTLRPARWRLFTSTSGWTVHAGLHGDDGVSPVVGRIRSGRTRIDGEWYEIEVLALPRLSDRRSRRGDTVPLDPSHASAARDLLCTTVWATGAPAALLGLLRMAHGVAPGWSADRVRLTTTDDPSPLAWLALADALEDAVEHQRRQYVRQRAVARAPVGTVRMQAWMAQSARLRPDRVPVERFTLSRDCLENRLFRGMAARMQRVVVADAGLGAWMGDRFTRVEAAFAAAQLVEPAAWMCDALLGRDLPAPIRAAAVQCRSALTGRTPGLDLKPGAVMTTRSFELDIAMLFEAAARTAVRAVVGRGVVDGNDTVLAHALQWTMPGGGPNRLKPDIAVVSGERVKGLGDAKYKRPHMASSYRPLSRADFQQLMTYLLAFPDAPWGLVLMPEVEGGAGPATQQVQALDLPGDRQLGVFTLSAERWGRTRLDTEPLARWLAARR